MDQYLEFISNHYLLVLALAAVTFLLIQDFVEHSFNKFTGISPMIAVTKMNSDETKIVDVREPHEFIKGHIEDAINIPLGKFDDQLDTLQPFKNNPIIVVCQSGTRSVPACKTLVKSGFEQVFNITGGMQSWEDNKLPTKSTSKNKN
ncbi:rhodanese-like domain-containing protein [Methylomarinum sp. Ch1-1]|uniref:Rhodanese-like domain-containing protein n=1 Tax=Methylomarinum roseum TaxID=3067653 RepID=A0AAU7NXS3_9GAMM|nr:rhodanese-like domain-containing protein [Methylomarinum sp. Ch1-1]MDP4522150.1 rhodanese-like domain-containing protein [Methylomarinum sp. Ch1-1]